MVWKTGIESRARLREHRVSGEIDGSDGIRSSFRSRLRGVVLYEMAFTVHKPPFSRRTTVGSALVGEAGRDLFSTRGVSGGATYRGNSMGKEVRVDYCIIVALRVLQIYPSLVFGRWPPSGACSCGKASEEDAQRLPGKQK